MGLLAEHRVIGVARRGLLALHRGLAEIAKLHLEKTVLDTVVVVEAFEPALERFQQRRQLRAATVEIGQILGVGVFDTDRLAPPLRHHRSIVDAVR